MNDFRIDSHKLIYHPQRIVRWLNGENIYPIFIEISPSGFCNHRCIFCAYDYLKYQGPFIEKDALIHFLSQARLSTKSILFSGEGEPLLHKDIAEIIVQTKKLNIDAALSTNGVLFTKSIASQTLPSLTWVRFSLDAATKETHARVHRCPPSDFAAVMRNITNAVKIKRAGGYDCTIGVQFLLLPENNSEVIQSAIILKEIGVDYLSVKPFYRRPMSHHAPNESFHYTARLGLDDYLQQLASDQFQVIFRAHAMEKLESEEREYEQCLGLPFITHLDSKGDMYTCNAFISNPSFCYGNIYNESFAEIWEGEKRKQVLEKVAKMDTKYCHQNCRLDEINIYLWSLKHREQVAHVNFI